MKGTKDFLLWLKTLEILSTTSVPSTHKTKWTVRKDQHLITVRSSNSNKDEEEEEGKMEEKDSSSG